MNPGRLDESAIAGHLRDRFAGIVPVSAWGEIAFFYNPGRALPRGVYFATLKARDGDNDRASRLDRAGVFRLNIGVGPATYRSLFGPPPARPAAGGVVATGHDFAALDTLMPHPVYAWMAWVAVLNPGPATFAALQPLLDEAYALAKAKFRSRVAGNRAEPQAPGPRPRRARP